MRARIGLFGGSFNPVHNGHLNLALELKERRQLDEVWLIPSLLSPLKQDEPLISAHHRLNMVQLAIEPLEGFQISSVELKRPAPSYTIDTVKELVSARPEAQFYLLLGEDSALHFGSWKAPLEVVRTLPVLIAARHHCDLEQRLPNLGLESEIVTALSAGITPTRELEISASDIRSRLKKGLYCGHLVPAKVLDYISAHQLYFNPLI